MRIDILPLEYNQKLMLIHYYQLGLRPNSSFTNYLNPVLLQQKMQFRTMYYTQSLCLFSLIHSGRVAPSCLDFHDILKDHSPHTHTFFFFLQTIAQFGFIQRFLIARFRLCKKSGCIVSGFYQFGTGFILYHEYYSS